ncbi:MAG: hypothetical protein ABIF10_02905 [Candidatus Woesearchaeota archaeon]
MTRLVQLKYEHANPKKYDEILNEKQRSVIELQTFLNTVAQEFGNYQKLFAGVRARKVDVTALIAKAESVIEYSRKLEKTSEKLM